MNVLLSPLRDEDGESTYELPVAMIFLIEAMIIIMDVQQTEREIIFSAEKQRAM